MKTVVVTAALAGLLFVVNAYGAGGSSPSALTEKRAALYQIDSIEKTWHKAASTKNLNLMMSVWASNATMTVPGQTVTGRAAIRAIFAKSGAFQPQNHWISDTAAYKVRATVNGNLGTLYFECHYIDIDTKTVVAVVSADLQVQKLNGKWLITNSAAGTATLQP